MFLLYILPYRFQRTWEGLTTISLIKVLLWREGVYKRGRKDILAFLIFSQFLILFSFFKGASVKLNKSLKKILVRSESKLLRICLLNIATKNMYHKRRFHSAWMFLENQSLIQFFFGGGGEGGSGRLVKQCKHDQNHKVMEKLSWDLRGTVMFDYCKISLG